MTDLATAYANAGKALLDLADALTAAEAPVPGQVTAFADGVPVEEPPTSWVAEDDYPEPVLTKNVGSAAVCPSHNIAYLKGRYGPYCPSTSQEPNFHNDKGYCTITPKNAAAWMRQRAAR